MEPVRIAKVREENMPQSKVAVVEDLGLISNS